MRVVETTGAFTRLLAQARDRRARVGVVPTMGALHAGHRSLIERAVAECDHVAVTVFVNPLQFGDPDDLARYPRPFEADLAVCEAAGVATVFAPSVGEMYPGWPAPVATTVSVAGLAAHWEGASRPGHFDGVATVVAKLFSMAGACAAYFGEKDFQQLVIVRRMVVDLSMPVSVVACPTVREADGLAISSRNVRLSPAERAAAPVLAGALRAGALAIGAGELRPQAVADVMAGVVATEPLVALDYAAAVDAGTLAVPPTLAGADVATGAVRLLVAARVGPVRLIDNCTAPVPARPGSAPDHGPGSAPDHAAGPVLGRELAGRRAGGHNLASGGPAIAG